MVIVAIFHMLNLRLVHSGSQVNMQFSGECITCQNHSKSIHTIYVMSHHMFCLYIMECRNVVLELEDASNVLIYYLTSFAEFVIQMDCGYTLMKLSRQSCCLKVKTGVKYK